MTAAKTTADQRAKLAGMPGIAGDRLFAEAERTPVPALPPEAGRDS